MIRRSPPATSTSSACRIVRRALEMLADRGRPRHDLGARVTAGREPPWSGRRSCSSTSRTSSATGRSRRASRGGSTRSLGALRSFDDAVAYPPNQVIDRQPRHRRTCGSARARGGGHPVEGAIAGRPVGRCDGAATASCELLAVRGPVRAGAPRRAEPREGDLPLFDGGGAAGAFAPAHEHDESLTAQVLLENLSIKASAVHALRDLLRDRRSIQRRSPTRSAAARRRSATGTSAAAATSRRRSPRSAAWARERHRREVVLRGAGARDRRGGGPDRVRYRGVGRRRGAEDPSASWA